MWVEVLICILVENVLMKYNLDVVIDLFVLIGCCIILVLGQVEDDVLIQFGMIEIVINCVLL